MPHSPTKIETPRIYLRSLSLEDCPALFGITHKHPDIADFMTWNPPKDLKEARLKFLEYKDPNDQRFAVFTKENDQLMGQVTVRNFHFMQQDAEKNSVFLSFWIDPDFQGQGLGTEIIAEVCRYCFVNLGIHKIFAGTFAENTASQKLLRKMNFREIGMLEKHYLKNGRYFDSIRFELLAENFS